MVSSCWDCVRGRHLLCAYKLWRKFCCCKEQGERYGY